MIALARAAGEGAHGAMPDPLFLGVDGGASHVRVRLRDAGGRCIGEGEGGPANSRLGIAMVLAEVMTATRQALAAAGLGERDLGRIRAGLGLAGATGPAERARVLAEPLPFAGTAVDSDAYIAWLGAFGGRDGAILIVGTGSCGLAVVKGERLNVGGWGNIVSDDGGGAELGRAALRRALWALEGMVPSTALADAILARFGRDPERVVPWAASAKAADFARLAPLVLEHAEARDPLAMLLLAETAGHVARMVERLLAAGAPAVALMGGLAEPIAPWLPPPLRARLAAPEADARDGAILLARGLVAEAGA
jgi:glucosamine kinase